MKKISGRSALRVIATSALALSLSGTTATALTPKLTERSPYYQAQLSNSIGMRLAQVASREDAKASDAKNMMISPISMHLALSMAYNGAADETHQQMTKVMGFNPKFEADVMTGMVNTGNQELQKVLSLAKVKPASEWEPPTPFVSIQNSAWSTNGKTTGRPFIFHKDFNQQLQASYYAEVSSEYDFKEQAATDAINKWVNDNTYGLIPKIIEFEVLKDMAWALINTTYFEGSWVKPFQTPGKADFKTLNGRIVKAEMIAAKNDFQYQEVTNSKGVKIGEAVSVPFYMGRPSQDSQTSAQIAFVAFLPSKKQNFSKIGEQMVWGEEGFWNQLSYKRTNTLYDCTDLTMPKFAFDYGVEMKKDDSITNSMGLNFMFDDQANFSAMQEGNNDTTMVGLIKQNTRIELDEKGVKAAAATLIGGVEKTAAPISKCNELKIDRPFYFAIVDTTTQTVLFAGSVVDPTAR